MATAESNREEKQSYDKELVRLLSGKRVLIKYGGNAMISEEKRQNVLLQIARLKELNIQPVVVHGGGPVIQQMLDQAGIETVFEDGHRVTTRDAMGIVELALSGKVNGDLVKGLNRLNTNAVGLSGKDGKMVQAIKRGHIKSNGEKKVEVDLGFVGDVDRIDTKIIDTLLNAGYLPVISPVASGTDGEDYNINADMFAGHLAGALKADAFVAITNVDGLMTDPAKAETRILSTTTDEVKAMFGTIIKGGMIPKIEACLIGLEKGVKEAHIVNGSDENSLLKQLLTKNRPGTTIK